jgi:hypothetical protein
LSDDSDNDRDMKYNVLDEDSDMIEEEEFNNEDDEDESNIDDEYHHLCNRHMAEDSKDKYEAFKIENSIKKNEMWQKPINEVMEFL